jgi:hypothetical protein
LSEFQRQLGGDLHQGSGLASFGGQGGLGLSEFLPEPVVVVGELPHGRRDGVLGLGAGEEILHDLVGLVVLVDDVAAQAASSQSTDGTIREALYEPGPDDRKADHCDA